MRFMRSMYITKEELYLVTLACYFISWSLCRRFQRHMKIVQFNFLWKSDQRGPILRSRNEKPKIHVRCKTEKNEKERILERILLSEHKAQVLNVIKMNRASGPIVHTDYSIMQ